MSLNQIYKGLFAEVIEDSFGVDLSRVVGAATHRDDRTCAFNRLTRAQLLAILRAARVVKVDPEKELATSAAQDVARYIIQAEYWQRNGAPDKAIRTQLNLARCAGRHGLRISSEPLTGAEAPEQETKMSTEETTATATEAAVKPAKKAAKKAAKPAKKASKNAAANAERKARLAEKKGPVQDRVARTIDRSKQLVKLVKTPAETEVPKQAFVIITLLKDNDRKLTLDVLLKKMEKAVTTKQPIGSIWAFYRGKLISEGYISVSKVDE